ncbi:hypothetical protein C7999DRAFT_33004 [Corynascus novoguineensis]|uniref:Uncharacterized protein n=1 Tax=Corynascus novoguineensis TaxID=1126955 RepID=A0AAN7HI87_9PEZI|nr:hypothetical protein C7999DRAFT_33004 [Corynascus novoguineensis]
MLPAELRIQVLSYITDLDDVSAVVHASPFFPQQHLSERQHLLAQAVKATQGNALVDAYIHRLSYDLAGPRSEAPGWDGSWVAWGIIDVSVELHSLSIDLPLLLECAARFPQNLKNALPDFGPLNGTERTRILRALYQFDIFQALYAYLDTDQDSWEQEGLDQFLGEMFDPWQVEEINCIEYLIRGEYGTVACGLDLFRAVTVIQRKLMLTADRDGGDTPTRLIQEKTTSARFEQFSRFSTHVLVELVVETVPVQSAAVSLFDMAAYFE